MSLRNYLEENKINELEDNQEFEEAEYTAIQTYCENCGYIIGSDDISIIKGRGLEDSFEFWKKTYVKDLWEEFEEVPMNAHTEEIEQPWKHFLTGTRREDISHWFEETFHIRVAEDLIGQCEH